jgi:hypothetical protein
VCVLPSRHRYFIGGRGPLWQAFWGVFGDFDVDDMLDSLGYQMPERLMGPILLWVYFFFATIVLVNLLIAQVHCTYVAVAKGW